MTGMQEPSINSMSIPFKKGINAEELIKLHLSERLQFPQRDYYYEYTVNADSLEVKYPESQKHCLLLKAQKKQKLLLKDYKKYVLYLLIICGLNYIVLLQNSCHFKIIHKQQIKSNNRIYSEQQKICQIKNVRSANELYLNFLNRIMVLPLCIQKLEITNSNFELSGYVDQEQLENFNKKILVYNWQSKLTAYQAGPYFFITLKGQL
ncbi:MAG: hypothetical protein PHV30_08020 [Candidatus Margulisbacteria bacterium]|nr:hypothetical protein [Candidatus Margulisiibacteriota bacterium]